MQRTQLSIVTPSFNQGHFLRETVDSVLGQRGAFDLEYWVMDGGSKDDTVEILKGYGEALRWISQKDEGQTAAINDGFRRSGGEILGWINADDVYMPDAFQRVIREFHARPEAMWLIGGYQMIDENGRRIRRVHSSYKNFLIRNYSYNLLLTENVCPQPSVFFRRRALEEVGFLNEKEYYVMDYDFWLRLGKKYEPIIVPEPLSKFRFHAGSKTQNSQLREQFGRELELAKRYTSAKPWLYLLHVLNYWKTLLLYRWVKW
ncbi:MAG: glycosyltransferase [Verrucomicrobiae bacterium]|nr:glycosyltransferase [Verrucomicrobiae bacterium]